MSNLTVDIRDSVVYTHLLFQIAPKDSGVRNPCARFKLSRTRARVSWQMSSIKAGDVPYLPSIRARIAPK